MELSKLERKRAIDKLKKSTSIAKYAFYEALEKNKITDEQLLKMVEYSEVMAMLKPVIDTNRAGQARRTREANIRTEQVEQELSVLKQQFMDFVNSEIVKLGKWLMDKLSLSGQTRKTELAKKDLVYIEDYQNDVGDLVGTLQEHNKITDRQLSENELAIQSLQETIDNQKKIIRVIKEEITQKYGSNAWNNIQFKIKGSIELDEAS
ncbi:hypothetical protein [Myxosarcina sp. GI1]|uniref:hypothetical protein n=1 Tax=Myxosarcina sp. GI1 TaxID=1541065 RepID=UPI00056AC2E9|nr:hypothetical protein [Myxosarcina sp. GI1]